jgi:hypothetical protein
MTIYKVTTELKTTWWLKLLRFCRVKKNRTEFEIFLNFNGFKIGDIIYSITNLKILEKEHQEGIFINNLGYC